MGLFNLKKGFNANDIKQLEKKFEIKLPDDYKEQVISINGKGYADSYIPHEVLGEVPYSRNVSLNKRDKYNIYDIYGKVIEDKRYFPFANTGTGNYYCFDLEKKQVVLWLHETEEIVYLCDSFIELMNMFCKYDDR